MTRSFSGVVGANHDQCGFKRMGQNLFNILSLNMILIVKRMGREHWRHLIQRVLLKEGRKEIGQWLKEEVGPIEFYKMVEIAYLLEDGKIEKKSMM